MSIRTLVMSAAIGALAAGAVAAQETTSGADKSAVAEGEMAQGADAPPFAYKSLEEMTVGDMIGMKVRDPEGATIGDIDYVIRDIDGADAVIGIGGFLGLGEYTVSMPLRDFGYDAEQDVLTLDTDKEALKALPEFDESGAESLPDETPIAELLEPGDPAKANAPATDASEGSGDAAAPAESSTQEADTPETETETKPESDG